MAAACGGGDEVRTGRVFLLGLDGADWARIDPLIEEGRLPAFEALRREGATGVLRSEDPMLSPILWTSIATGRTPLTHGVVSFLTRDDAGRETPVTSLDVGARPVWQVVSDLGGTATVVGWYATWPAAEIDGVVVSDRVAGHQVGRGTAPAEGLVHPPDALPAVEDVLASTTVDLARDIFPFLVLSESERAGEEPVRLDRHLADAFGAVHRGVLLNTRLALRLWSERPTDLMAAYVEAPDAVLHLFGEYEPPQRAGVDDADFARYREVVPRYLELLDAGLRDVMAALGPEDTLVVASDHGFHRGEARPPGAGRAGTGHAPAWHHKDGLLAVWGAGSVKAVRLPEASLYDVAPTVLRLLDLPLAEDLDGRVIAGALSPDVLARRVRTVESFGPPDVRRAPAGPAPGTDERIALLRSLGYLGGSGTGEDAGSVEEAYNRGLVALVGGDLSTAARAFADVESLAPGRGLSQLGLGEVAWRRGDLDRAGYLFGEAAARMPRAVLPRVNRGLVRLASGDLAGARADLERALEEDPLRFATLRGLGEIALRDGRPGEAVEHLDRAREVAGDGARRADAGYLCGLALMRLGRSQEAEQRLRAVLEDRPDHPDALFRMASLAMETARPDEAADWLARLMAAVTPDARLHRMRAQALEAAGRPDEARAELDAAARLESVPAP